MIVEDNILKEENRDYFLEITIDNWLTSINELGYQLPFCQLLLNDGYSICHSSKHNAFEQGKDIIAINRDGVPCGFQLKGGDITNARWKNEVKAEIEELIDYRIVHPSVDKSKKHKSFLVTNGELEDTVRIAIDNLNTGKWKDNPLQVIIRGQLLKKFLELSGDFVPQYVADYKSFLDLYFADGRELIDEQRFTNFIAGVLCLHASGLSKERCKRNIATAILFTGYIISPFKRENNHVSVIQTLILLSAHILALVERYDLEDQYWHNSFEIVWMEIMNASQLLQDEIKNDGLLKLVTSIWDGELGKYRRHIAVSFLLAFKVAQLIEGNPKWKDMATDDFFTKLQDSLTVWGEASFFPFLLLFLYTNKSSVVGDANDLFRPLYIVLEAIIGFNGRKSRVGILSPYYGITTLIKMKFGLLEEPIDENFSYRSFMLKPIVDLLARHDKRKELEECWREITYISTEEFIPNQLWMHLLWHCEKGESKSQFTKQEQSWKELKELSGQVVYNLIPKVLRKQTRFLPFFLLVHPHRITTDYIKLLDEVVAGA